MTSFFRILFNWLFPHNCLGCDKDDVLLCDNCLQQLEIPKFQICPLCRKTSEWGLVCFDCRENNLRGLAIGFNYQKKGFLAKMLHLYKYEGLTEYGIKLSDLLNARVQKDFKTFIEDHFDFVTWVPLGKKIIKKRGFNQAEQLARSLSIDVQRIELLEKKLEARSQMELKRFERLVNLKGAFAVRPLVAAQLAGKRILIVDDVATTLATLEECAGTLLGAGAVVVYGLVLARQME